MDALAQRLIAALPKDGSKISGGTIKDRLGIGTIEYGQAKKELKEEGFVELGKGRGGTISLTDKGKTYTPPKVTTLEERLEVAREVKAEKSKAEQERDTMREAIVQIGWQRHPDADDIKPGLYEDRYYVEVWKGRQATPDFFPQELLL